MKPARLLAALAAALVSPTLSAQIAASPGYRLDAWILDAEGGGSASIARTAWGSLASAGGALGSPSYGARVGFLGVAEPAATGGPVIFGVAPHFGTKDGGTPATVSGSNFDKLGSGPTVAVAFDGIPAGGVSVLSSTQIALATPAGAMGPSDVQVSSSLGSDLARNAFVHTPAVTSPASVPKGSALAVANWGPLGGSFELWLGFTQTSIPLPPYGTLLIGPGSLTKLASAAYPGPNGIHQASFAIPGDPALAGVALHFQSVAIVSFAPLTALLTNSTSTTIL